MDAYQAVRETDYEYNDPLQMNIVSNQFYYTAIFSCPKCAKFYHEVLEKTSIFDYIGKHVRRLYGSYNFHYGLNMDEDDMCDVLLVDSGLRKEFFCYMFNNFGYNLEPKVISKYLRKLNIYLGRILNVDKKIILSCIDEAEQLVKKTDISHLHLL